MAQNGTNQHAVAGILGDACSYPISIGCVAAGGCRGSCSRDHFGQFPDRVVFASLLIYETSTAKLMIWEFFVVDIQL